MEKEKTSDSSPLSETCKGTVAQVMSRQVSVQVKNKRVTCPFPDSLILDKNSLTVGDKAELILLGEQYRIVRILPRKNGLYRGSRYSEGEEIIVAANVDLILAAVTGEAVLKENGYLDQAFLAAKRTGVGLGVVVSKWDLVSEKDRPLVKDKLQPYEKQAEFVLYGTGETLVSSIAGKRTVVVGESGSGKTRLIQTLLSAQGGKKMVLERSPGTRAGILYKGSNGTILIDTPGFRDFALSARTEEEKFMEIKEPKKIDYRNTACLESFSCKACGKPVVAEGAGSRHRNHCPSCLSSVHVDNEPGDRASGCGGVMEPVSVWVRGDGEWALIHRCKTCGALSSNRIAADDSPLKLMSIAIKPLANPPFPLELLERLVDK